MKNTYDTIKASERKKIANEVFALRAKRKNGETSHEIATTIGYVEALTDVINIIYPETK